MSNFNNDNFDWSIYDNGYNGHNLKENKKVVKTDPKTKVYCHEHYAQDLYNHYMNVPTATNFMAKDMLKNSIFTVSDITPVSATEVIVDTIGGGSARIDLLKEKDYLRHIGCDNIATFVKSLTESSSYKKSLMDTMPVVKVVDSNRISLWEGHKHNTEQEFMQQIKKPTCAYYAKLESINNGGYIVDVNSVKAFLPGSLAQANKILDYDALVGKTIPVMIDSYLPKTGFIVSYKKYLATILPTKIANELTVGMAVDAEVTGVRKGNVFMQFADSNGDMIFTGLLPQDNMTTSTKHDVEHGQFKPGSKWRVFISDITENNRIVFSDSPLLEYPAGDAPIEGCEVCQNDI